MALINVSPIMTSNTTPTPYVVSASNTFSSLYPYNAFSNNANQIWMSLQEKAWLCIDMGMQRKLTHIGFTNNSSTFNTLEILGSNDGTDFELIRECIWDSSAGSTNDYDLGGVVYYRYYKFQIVSGSSTIGKVRLLIDEDYIGGNSKNSVSFGSFGYQLPMNTTKNIIAKQNDSRIGLLGMANDDENFGDLYVVGKDSMSHLTKSGIKTEVIFDGKAQVNNTYSLEKPITDFKEILVTVSADHNVEGENCYKNSTAIFTNEIALTDYKQFISTLYSTNYISYTFTDSNTLKICSIGNLTSGWKSIQIINIIGIY